jgi:hypothetical protein
MRACHAPGARCACTERRPVDAARPPSEEEGGTAGAKRKRSGLLSPEEAAQLVNSTTASYIFAGDADAEGVDAGFYSGGPAIEAAAKGAHIGTESSRTVEVPDATVGYLLAGGGKQIKAIELASGCRVVVDRSGGGGGRKDAAARHSGDKAPRKVTLVGSDVALRDGERRLQEAVLASSKFLQKTIRCNATQAGSIIGRGGAVVKRLQAATSTHISVSGREEGGGSADAPRTVSIKGAPWNVELASRFIFAAMRDPGELAALMADAETARASGADGGAQGHAGAAGYGDAATYAAQYGNK